MGSSRPAKKRFSAEVLMRKVASSLVSDFQVSFSDPLFCSDYQTEIRLGNIAAARELSPVPDDAMDPAMYKAVYQIASVLKRYRFEKDTYSDEELLNKAVASYLETQTRLAALDLEQLSATDNCILDLAAGYVARILGPYDDEECRLLCRFGNGASVGVPARKACEAERWELPLTGSQEQISWFDSEMSHIESVQDYWLAQLERDPEGSIYRETSSLTLSLVPKTFKSLRAIMPNTTIGSYMSDGIGKVIRQRLKREGYDIAKLQQEHRVLAQSASVHSLYTTADLSSASDSISVALVNRLFPKDWCDILHKSRIGTVVLPNGQRVESETFCTMGIGYTFPLQTLVFLALLKAIEHAHYGPFDRRRISVYGDDLIYASRMHKYVAHYFEKFGFVLNEDKTFSTGHFRESCGGDYFHGVDVRPYQPRNGAANVGPKAYEAILYKHINTLLVRWSEYEIGGTLRMLLSEVVALVGKAKVVPLNYPDDSGIKCPSLTFYEFCKGACAQPKNLGNGVYRFSYLRLVPDVREEKRHGPYLWLALRGVDDKIDYRSNHLFQDLPSPLVTWINQVVGVVEAPPTLLWQEVHPIVLTRSKLTGRRLRRMASFVTVSHSGRYMRQSGTSCFEDRRQIA